MKEIAAMNELNPEWNQAGTDVVLQDRDIKEYEAERRKKLEEYAYAELMEKYLGGGSLSVMEFQYAGPFAETLTNLYHTAAPINEMAEKTAKKLMALNLQIEEAEEEIASLKEAGKMRRR